MADLNPFTLIDDSQVYCQKIRQRCADLIVFNVWEGLDFVKVEQWLSNFQTDEEQYFACRLLDNLIFKSEKQVVSMLKQLFQRTLPDLFAKHSLPFPENTADLAEHIGQEIVLVGALKPDDSIDKSAPLIARLIKLHCGCGNTIHPRDIPRARTEGAKIFIFIDDLLASGSQFDEVLSKNNLTSWPIDETFIYTPLVAHISGAQFLTSYNEPEKRDMYSRLIIDAVEWLDKENQVFHHDSSFFEDGENSADSARKFYYDMLKKYNISNTWIRRGFGDLELCYAFSHAAPDNCLSILWYGENGWKPLFNR